MKWNFAACVTSWLNASSTKSGRLCMKTGRMPFIAAPVRHAHHPFFGQRRVEHARPAEPGLQPVRRAEHRGRIVDALAEHEHAGIVLERQRQRLVDRLRRS